MPVRTFLLVAALLMLGSTVLPVSAKGGPYVVGATVSGGGLPAPRSIGVVLHEGYDDMSEAAVPEGGETRLSDWYDITLDYDFEEEGYGRRQRKGKFDGADYLYFPEAMIVGPGAWAAGWYQANPLFMAELQRALTPAPPATGSGVVSAGRADLDLARWLGAALLAAAAGLLARTRP